MSLQKRNSLKKEKKKKMDEFFEKNHENVKQNLSGEKLTIAFLTNFFMQAGK